MIGVIAGEGTLPKLIVKKFKEKKINYILINLSKKKIIRKNYYNFTITQISSIINILKKKIIAMKLFLLEKLFDRIFLILELIKK